MFIFVNLVRLSLDNKGILYFTLLYFIQSYASWYLIFIFNCSYTAPSHTGTLLHHTLVHCSSQSATLHWHWSHTETLKQLNIDRGHCKFTSRWIYYIVTKKEHLLLVYCLYIISHEFLTKFKPKKKLLKTFFCNWFQTLNYSNKIYFPVLKLRLVYRQNIEFCLFNMNIAFCL